jgi:hypothetical protein
MDQAAKSVTAKLLATENITVVQDNVRTAMFDVKNRVLTLPMWADVAPYTEDHLIGHEVGHAIYTPLEGWHDAVCAKGAGYKSFLNVVEDARIEKLIQRKYPGLRAPFIKSYRKLLADGFFGADIDAINQMGLIDRINTYFKCGMSAGIKFTDDEKQWLPRIENAETWEDVVAITDDLFGFCKEELEKQKEEAKQRAEELAEEEVKEQDDDEPAMGWDEDDSDDDLVEETEAGESASEEGDDFTEGNTPASASSDADDSEEEEDEWEGDFDAYTDQAGGAPAEPMSNTDKTLRDSINNEIYTSHGGKVTNLRVSDYTRNWKDYVISHKDVVNEILNGDTISDKIQNREVPEWRKESIASYTTIRLEQIETFGTALYNEWSRVNKKAINAMVKEFEMKKSAGEHRRALTSKTGVIDTVKMNNYKFSDDIFKKVTIVPEGKNHGFIMYLDMSGSMFDVMYETVEQTLLLTHFCRQINVPFRVYGFTNSLSYGQTVDQRNFNNGTLLVDDGRLLELFSSEQRKPDMILIAKALLAEYCRNVSKKRMNELANSIGFINDRTIWNCARRYQSLDAFRLGGTPMDEAIAIGTPLAIAFRKQHQLDVLNTFFLTDGMSHEMNAVGMHYSPVRSGLYGGGYVTITCPLTNRTFRGNKKYDYRNVQATDMLLAMYKNATGSNVIGYRISENSRRSMESDFGNMVGFKDWTVMDELWKQYSKEGFINMNAVGYDECYLIRKSSLMIVDSKIDDSLQGATKGKLRTAFKKSMIGSKKSRKMLNDLVAKVA